MTHPCIQPDDLPHSSSCFCCLFIHSSALQLVVLSFLLACTLYPFVLQYKRPPLTYRSIHTRSRPRLLPIVPPFDTVFLSSGQPPTTPESPGTIPRLDYQVQLISRPPPETTHPEVISNTQHDGVRRTFSFPEQTGRSPGTIRLLLLNAIFRSNRFPIYTRHFPSQCRILTDNLGNFCDRTIDLLVGVVRIGTAKA